MAFKMIVYIFTLYLYHKCEHWLVEKFIFIKRFNIISSYLRGINLTFHNYILWSSSYIYALGTYIVIM